VIGGYWIKLYIEVLDDPKMARLPDRLWRRAVELFLMAGKEGRDGLLPDVEAMAWTLRMPVDELTRDLNDLARTGIVGLAQGEFGEWTVTNFAERQAPRSEAERKAMQRDRERSRQYHGQARDGNGHELVTDVSRNVTQINRLTDTETEGETEGEGGADAPSQPAPPAGEDYENFTVAEAQKVPEIRVYAQATGRMPGRPLYRRVVETIRACKLKPDDLRPYWTEWNARGYNPNAIAWLTDWAVKRSIPDARGSPSVPKNGAAKGTSTLDQLAEMRRSLDGNSG
jgi:hypothetical protein